MKNFLITLGFITLITTTAFSQELDKKSYKATFVTSAPVIDGVLNDSVWKEGVWIDDFTQNEPYNNKPPSQKTEFKILYDDNNLYVAIKAYDTSPDSIVNRMTRRDEADGDLLAIIVDSYHDLRTAFCFGVSSAGVKYDQMFTGDGQNQDGTWDPNWWVKTSLNKEGWVAEMKIPFSQVRFEKSSGDVWGLEMARIIYRRNETDFWQHIPKDAPGLVHLFGELKGLENIKPRKIFDVTPYGVAKVETYKADPTNPFLTSGKKYNATAGIDAKIGVTNNMTMDLTINPDFGQVEADPSVVNLTAYETFFKEKRPFFIEGNNITNFNLGIGNGDVGNDNIFYSRRIGRLPQGSPNLENDTWKADVPGFTNIIGATKLTGKTQNGLSVGFIEAVTAQMNATIDTVGGKISQPVEPLTNYLMARVQKDINSGNTIIGGIFTSTNRDLDANLATFMHKAAYTGGIDFTQYFKKKSWMLSLNGAVSEVEGTRQAIELTQESSARYFQRPDNHYVRYDTTRTSLLGSGGKVMIQKLNGHWNVLGSFIWKSPEFELNDMGYLRQADQMLTVLWVGYNQWEPKGIYRRYNLSLDNFDVVDFGGDWLSKGLETNASMTFKNYWNAYIYGNATTAQLSTALLRGGPMIKMPGTYNSNLGVNTDYRKKIVFNVNAGINGGYQNSSGSFYTSIGIDFKPTNFLLFSLNPSVSISHDKLQYVAQDSYGTEPRYIFASIDQKTIGASLRVNINITPDLTFQYWGQPFVASGNYHDYKYITNPMAGKYTDRFHVYTGSEITDNGNGFNIDENHDGNMDYQINYNNFNYRAFLSNLVIRWEYSPGSSVYLVWSQTRNTSDGTGTMDYLANVKDLFGYKPVNVFLVKFSYRFGLK
jgi:Domain of unknown function (DUF5916)/Carbohydrate family 9 binding domain-like